MLGILVIVSVNIIKRVGEYLDYENRKCRKKLVDILVDECTEIVEEVKLVKITHAKNANSYKCSFSKVCVALSLSVFKINIGIATYYIYSQCYLKKMLLVLGLILTLKQTFTKLIKWEQPNKLILKIELIIFTTIKFDLKDFDASMLKVDKKKIQRD